MVSIPEEVRCAVCKNIFCCMECRNRHEQNAHNPNDVWIERNRMRCGFCQGQPTMEFQSRNDFALIMHLCQAHLPLHCKKCLTQFNSIGDFSAANKCAHVNDVCNLQSPKESNAIKIETQCSSNNAKDTSSNNYVTAVQKGSFERSISDSVISFRNYSTILHTSNHPLYKTQSPDAMEKALVRQTSTPMHHNLLAAKSPESNGQSCNSCLVSSTSGHVSSMNSSSESDSSITAASKPNDIRQNVQQQSIMVTQKKTTTFKRSRNSLAGTPLTRQVMTKSIHRAILEYKHTQNGVAVSPKSPLDLRVRTTIHRDSRDVHKGDIQKTTKADEKSPKLSNENKSPTVENEPVSLESNSKQNSLKTVFEHERDTNFKTIDCNNYIESEYSSIEVINDDGTYSGPDSIKTIGETPTASRKLSSEKTSGYEHPNPDVWYTPKEYVQSKIVENIEIYTPKISKKRTTVRRFDDGDLVSEIETENETHHIDRSKNETNRGSGNKLWSMVSTFLRFASLTPQSDMSMPELKRSDDQSHVMIKRCASFSDVLQNGTTSASDEEDNMDPLQPIKRRRITSMDQLHTSSDPVTGNYRKRITGRPPIRRMLNN